MFFSKLSCILHFIAYFLDSSAIMHSIVNLLELYHNLFRGHLVYQQGQDCFISKGSEHLANDCPEMDQGNNLSSNICLRCGDSGHDLFSCGGDYLADDLKVYLTCSFMSLFVYIYFLSLSSSYHIANCKSQN